MTAYVIKLTRTRTCDCYVRGDRNGEAVVPVEITNRKELAARWLCMSAAILFTFRLDSSVKTEIEPVKLD